VEYLETGTYQKEISNDEKLDYIIDHMNRLLELKGEKVALLEMRTHSTWYIKGMRGASHIKREMAQVSTKEGLLELVEQYRNYLKEGPQ